MLVKNLGSFWVDPVKLAIFLLFFVGFFIITRRMFSGGPSISPGTPPPQPSADSWTSYPSSNEAPVIGSELPFPVKLPPVERNPDGRYNRPKVLNYYFSNLDLRKGPENPISFCDQLFIQFESPETGASWTSEYIIATPFGLQDLLDQTGQNLVFDGTIIVVPRWNMAEILKAVLDDTIQRYVGPDAKDTGTQDTSKRYWG